MKIPDNPKALGVPHAIWRASQKEIIKDAFENDGEFFIVEAPTGTGKTSIATALGAYIPVLAVCHTLSLLNHYEKYGFAVIRGRQEYPCVLRDKVERWKKNYGVAPLASDCHFDQMHKCPASKECPYLIAKNNVKHANRAACTYRYIGLSYAMQSRGGNIVLDEAHDAAEELISFCEFKVTNDYIGRHLLPVFPNLEQGVIDDEMREEIKAWLEQCINRFLLYVETIDENNEITWKKSKKASAAQRSHRRFTRMKSELQDKLFLEIGTDYIALKALTAHRVANKIFSNKHTKLLMSATIGHPEPLAQALGISEYTFESYPHPVPAHYRMVKDLKLPKMIKRNLDQHPHLYLNQAKAIANWISDFPVEWRGAILTVSYHKISMLYENIKDLLPNHRFIVQKSGEKVGNVVERFISDVQPSDIMIGTVQGMGSGLDLYGDVARWIVVAGTPHVNPVDEYAKARRAQFGGIKYQHWNTYCAVMQSCGRVSRGEQDDAGNFLPNFAALADGSAMTKTAQRYYSNWFKESVV